MTTETGTTTRERRGLALFREGAVSVHGDAFVVRGAERNYTVFLHGGEPRCDCPDFEHRCREAGRACKHGFAVVAFAARRSCHRRRAMDRPTRRHAEVSPRPRGNTGGAAAATTPSRPDDVAPES